MKVNNKSSKEWASVQSYKIINKEIPEYYFQFDNAKRRAGCCSYRRKRISLSKYFVEHNSKKEVMNTILHEVAHAMAGYEAGHGPKWKAIFTKLLIKYNQPLDVNRCYDSKKIIMPKGKHILECDNCKIPHYRLKRMWWMKQIDENGYVSGYCGKCKTKTLRYYRK